MSKNTIKVLREDFAKLIYKLETKTKETDIETLQLIQDGKNLISAYDKEEEIKEVGTDYTQLKLFR